MRYSKVIQRLFWDIETVAATDAEDWIDFKISKALKDPEKIAEAEEAAKEEALEKAGLDADIATVKSVSMQIALDGEQIILIVPTKKLSKKKNAEAVMNATAYVMAETGYEPKIEFVSEEELITKFWEHLIMCNGNNVGYNQLGFDIPFMLRRSFALGIKPGIMVSQVKYRTEPTTDLMSILSGWAWGGSKKLKWIAERYGLTVLAPGDSGAGVAEMNDNEIALYSLSDLMLTIELYEKMDGIYFNHLSG